MNILHDRLRPWQHAPVDSLLASLRKYRVGLDMSDTGTGKTFVACAVAKILNLPTLVVCPKIAMTAWKKVAAHFDDTVSVINYESLRTGNTPFGAWTHPKPAPVSGGDAALEFTCQCCQQKINPATCAPCYTNPAGVHCVVARKVPWNYGNFRFAQQPQLIIFDESHRAGARDSLNADMLIAAKRDNKMVMCLSATAAVSPLQMRALGYVLGLHTLTPKYGLGYYDWLRTVGCGKLDGLPGFRWTVGEARQKAVMEQLHARLIPEKAVRIRTAEIPNFPTRTITAEEYDIENPERIDALYAEMQTSLDRWKSIAATDIAPDSPLTSILRARQFLEICKVPLAVEMCNDYIAKGCSVALFCNFSETIDALAARLNTNCIIDGRPGNNRPGMRDYNVAQFQQNIENKIILNNEAGGIAIGLTDLRGDHPRVGLVFPCWSAVTMRQVFGRLPRDGGRSHSLYRVLFAAGTVEGGMARALRAKSNNLDCLNDADLQPENFRLTKR